MKSTLFITATGTEIGKTYLCELLITQAKRMGKIISAVKPVLSGLTQTNMENCDSIKILNALGLTCIKSNIDKISPWQYNAALTPSMASKLESKNLDFNSLINYCKKNINQQDLYFIEGVGGLMSPITKNKTCLEWVQALNCSTVLVTGSYLGSISHTLCTLNTMLNSNVKVSAIFLNETVTSTVNLQKTYKELQTFCKNIPIYTLYYKANKANFKTVEVFLNQLMQSAKNT